jgi:hypothetical protein
LSADHRHPEQNAERRLACDSAAPADELTNHAVRKLFVVTSDSVGNLMSMSDEVEATGKINSLKKRLRGG